MKNKISQLKNKKLKSQTLYKWEWNGSVKKMKN